MSRPRQFETAAALEQAMTAFWERGYENASVQHLCDAMGIRPASLYGAFGDKRGLFLEALDAYTRRSQAGFAAALAGLEGAQGIRCFFAWVVDRRSGDDRGHWGCLITNTATEVAREDPEVAGKVEAHWRRLEAMLANLLAEAEARGELRPGAGAASAPALLCLAQGLNVLAKTRPGRARLEAVVAAALDGVLIPET